MNIASHISIFYEKDAVKNIVGTLMEIFKNIAVKISYQECLLVVTILIVNIDVGFKVTGAKELSEETSALL